MTIGHKISEVREDALKEGIEIGIDKGIGIGVDKGIGIGVDKGIVIGIDKGRQEGREEGRVESNEQNDKILLVLLGNPKATNSEISAITGATDERINKIRNIINRSKA